MTRLLAVRSLVLGAVLSMALSLVAVSATADAPRTTAAVTAGGPNLMPERKLVQRAYEDGILALTNQERQLAGCPALRASKPLRKAARRHSVEMAMAGEMSHQLPGEAKFSTRITRAGYRGWRLVAENVARGFSSPEAVMDAWMDSPTHRRNILNCRIRDLGVGVVLQGGQLWWTQDFGTR